MNRNPLKRHKVNSLGSASLGDHPRQSLSIGIPRQSLGTSNERVTSEIVFSPDLAKK
jgi:hypothetical protein